MEQDGTRSIPLKQVKTKFYNLTKTNMQNSTKILIGVVVIALIGASLYFGNTKLQKGSLGDMSRNSLIVSLSSTPLSETVLPGQDAKMIGLTLKNGSSNDVVISKITVRINADDDGKFDYVGYGDTPANTIVETVSLYKINSDNTETQISSPVGLTVSGTINQAKYYAAVFQNLNYTISKFSTEKWLVKAKTANNVSKTYYVAADLIPDLDIQATTIVKNGSGSNGNGINGLLKKDVPTVFKTVAVKGTLNVIQEGSPEASVVVGGKVDAEFAKYKFTASNEAFSVKKLDVVIDSNENFANTTILDLAFVNSIKAVNLSYAKKDKTIEKVSGVFVNGVAKFENLNFYVPKDGSATLTISADLNTIEPNGASSGAAMRIGLSEFTTNNGFEAQGENSGATLKFSDISKIINSTNVKIMVVRKTVPIIAKLPTASSKLNNGQNDIAAITIHAFGPEVAVKKLTFNVAYSPNLTISNIKLYRKIGGGGVESDITNVVSIKNSAGANLKSGGTKLANGTQDTIYVIWDDQEFIPANVQNTYILRAIVSGAQANNTISTYIPAKKLEGILTADVNLVSKYNNSVIWSDVSAPNHSTSTIDWTDDYLLPGLPTDQKTITF